jgi:hypothetical protein
METQSVKKKKKTKWSVFNTISSKELEIIQLNELLELRSENSNYIRNPTWTKNPSEIRIG